MSMLKNLNINGSMSPLGQKIRRNITRAISDYSMLKNGDKILVAVSGGIDSSVLLLMLKEIKRKAKIDFALVPVFLDQKFPRLDPAPFKNWLNSIGFELTILEFDSYRMIVEKTRKNKSACGICARMRRGILYSYAFDNGFNKIALGHNRNDLNETVLMNMLFSGKMSGMPPKLRSKDGKNTLIRPLCYVAKDMIEQYGAEARIPILENTFCDEKGGGTRSLVRNILKDLDTKNPKTGENLIASLKNVHLSQLMDKNLWDFDKLERRQ